MVSLYTDKVNDVHRVTVACMHADEQLQVSDFHIMCTQTGGTDTRPQVAAFCSDAIMTNYMPLMANNAEFLGTKIAPALTDRPYYPIIDRQSHAGSAGTTTLPTQMRPLLRLVTPLSSRKYRGRMFAFTPAQSQLTPSGQPGSGVFAGWRFLIFPFIAGVSFLSSKWIIVIRHRLPKKVAGPEEFPTLVTDIQDSGRFASQHKSGDFGKQNLAPW